MAKKWSGHGESDHISLSEDAWSFAIHSSLRSLLGTDFKDDKLVQSVNNAFCKVRNLNSQVLRSILNRFKYKDSCVISPLFMIVFHSTTYFTFVNAPFSHVVNIHNDLPCA